jgi:nucleotide-binding universal stress UspA family protein
VDRRFVAGFDGSADARAAAHWAAAEAVSRDVDLIVVTSYRAPEVSTTSSGAAQAMSARALIERDTHLAALEALAEELRRAHPGLTVSGRVIEGPHDAS